MIVSGKQITALKRKKGELDLSGVQLAKSIGISPKTIYKLMNNSNGVNVYPSTFKKLNDWIIDQYTTLK